MTVTSLWDSFWQVSPSYSGESWYKALQLMLENLYLTCQTSYSVSIHERVNAAPNKTRAASSWTGCHQMALKSEKMVNLPIMREATLFSRRTEVKGPTYTWTQAHKHQANEESLWVIKKDLCTINIFTKHCTPQPQSLLFFKIFKFLFHFSSVFEVPPEQKKTDSTEEIYLLFPLST